MARLHVRVVGGSCGNSMYAVTEHLTELIERAGYNCRLTTQNVWETTALPPNVDLILQLMPVFTADEAGCPVVYIKRLLIDRNHPPTIRSVFEALEQVSGAAAQ